MKILFDFGHPSHYHLYKHVIGELEKQGDDVLIIVRDREGMVSDLIRADGRKFIIIDKNVKKGLFNKLLKMIAIDVRLFRIASKFKPDLFVSMGSPYAGQVGFLMRRPHLSFVDTEDAKFAIILLIPFTTEMIVPSSYCSEFSFRNTLRTNSYKVLAYLHPDFFKPNREVLRELNLSETDKIAILRFSSFDASHDIGKRGIVKSSRNILALEIAKLAKVFITSEIDLGNELEKFRLRLDPSKLHDLLAFSNLYVGEGATMACEAAVLGIPAVFVHRNTCSVLEDLEREGLLLNFHDPEKDFDFILEYCRNALTNPKIKNEHLEKRQKMLNEKEDLTDIIVKEINKLRN